MATPFLLKPNTDGSPLVRIPFAEAASGRGFAESWLQEVLYANPGLLPCDEVDSAYTKLIPLCREMATQAGPIDLAYVTPAGKIVLVETKLWRNPEARRKVVAQTLDYAKEVCLWDFADLETAVRGAEKDPRLSIHRRVNDAASLELDEATFCDNVSRTLRTGQFMLLIVGDGIREGVGAMTEFLDRFGSLQFSFGLIELAVYDGGAMGRLVVPRVIAKTAIMKRTIVAIDRDGTARIADDAQPSAGDQPSDDQDPKARERAGFYRRFWSEFLSQLHLDDATQPMPQPNDSTNIFFSMPPSGSTAWVSAYFAQSKHRVGVYLTFSRQSAFGQEAWEALTGDRASIEAELGFNTEWVAEDGKYSVVCRLPYADLLQPQTLAEIKVFFAEKVNRFVSVFRPRLERIASEL